jgi:hypothetical protein
VEVERYSVAVARGKRPGRSTVIRLTPPSLSTCTGGGACAAGSCFWPPQPLNIQKLRTAAGTTVCFMNRPHQPNAEFRSFRGKALVKQVSQSPCLLTRRAGWLETENRPSACALDYTSEETGLTGGSCLHIITVGWCRRPASGHTLFRQASRS